MANGGQSVLSPEERLILELRDPEYRRAFVEGHAKDTIAFQLRALRNAKDWDQRDVAERLGNRKLQPMISRYENPDYGRYSIATLLELANAFDVALAVRFVPFSELAEWDLWRNRQTVYPVSFSEDKALDEIAERGHIRQQHQTSRHQSKSIGPFAIKWSASSTEHEIQGSRSEYEIQGSRSTLASIADNPTNPKAAA